MASESHTLLTQNFDEFYARPDQDIPVYTVPERVSETDWKNERRSRSHRRRSRHDDNSNKSEGLSSQSTPLYLETSCPQDKRKSESSASIHEDAKKPGSDGDGLADDSYNDIDEPLINAAEDEEVESINKPMNETILKLKKKTYQKKPRVLKYRNDISIIPNRISRGEDNNYWYENPQQQNAISNPPEAKIPPNRIPKVNYTTRVDNKSITGFDTNQEPCVDTNATPSYIETESELSPLFARGGGINLMQFVQNSSDIIFNGRQHGPTSTSSTKSVSEPAGQQKTKRVEGRVSGGGKSKGIEPAILASFSTDMAFLHDNKPPVQSQRIIPTTSCGRKAIGELGGVGEAGRMLLDQEHRLGSVGITKADRIQQYNILNPEGSSLLDNLNMSTMQTKLERVTRWVTSVIIYCLLLYAGLVVIVLLTDKPMVFKPMFRR